MKRVDFVVSEPELDALIKAIKQSGSPGYTVMRHVTGQGPRGAVSEAMDFSGLGANAHVIVFCEPNVLETLREKVAPLLNYYGGVAYASEAEPL
jgi:nitrogen regulatory protein PII